MSEYRKSIAMLAAMAAAHARSYTNMQENLQVHNTNTSQSEENAETVTTATSNNSSPRFYQTSWKTDNKNTSSFWNGPKIPIWNIPQVNSFIDNRC